MRILGFSIFSIIILAFNHLAAQHTEWSSISVNQLKMTKYADFPDASAIMIFDVGTLSFSIQDGRSRLERHVRIHILSEEGIKHAEQSFVYYAQGRQEHIAGLQAQTFNLEGNDLVKKQLARKDFFVEQFDEGFEVVKFAFQDVKVGSVLEFKYTFISQNLFSPRPWYFQHEIPVLFSRLHAIIPDNLSYTYVFNGSMANQVKTPSKGILQLNNIPAIKEEPYVTRIDDYRQNIRFQLDTYVANGRVEKVLQDWPEFTKDLLGPEGLAKTLKKSKLAKARALQLTDGIDDAQQKLQVLYKYVRDYIEWNGENGVLSDSKLDDILEQQKGKSSEMNLLLMAMLRAVDIEAYPLLISTRSHGRTISNYPLLAQFNRIICYSKINDKTFFLNTVNPLRPYNLPAFSDLNHRGWLLDEKNYQWIDIPRTYSEAQSHFANVSVNEEAEFSGAITSHFGGYNALSFRSAWKSSEEEEFLDAYIGSRLVEGSYSNPEVEHIENLEKSVKLAYELNALDFAEKNGDYLYINPMLMYGIEENPFLSPERNFPIDFGNLIKRTYVLKLSIPENYEIESLPKNVKVRFPDGNVQFEFGSHTNGNIIDLRSTFSLKDSYFIPESYPAFKELYDNMIKKHSEQIVLRKKTSSND